jgi:hypothetical protein
MSAEAIEFGRRPLPKEDCTVGLCYPPTLVANKGDSCFECRNLAGAELDLRKNEGVAGARERFRLKMESMMARNDGAGMRSVLLARERMAFQHWLPAPEAPPPKASTQGLWGPHVTPGSSTSPTVQELMDQFEKEAKETGDYQQRVDENVNDMKVTEAQRKRIEENREAAKKRRDEIQSGVRKAVRVMALPEGKEKGNDEIKESDKQESNVEIKGSGASLGAPVTTGKSGAPSIDFAEESTESNVEIGFWSEGGKGGEVKSQEEDPGDVLDRAIEERVLAGTGPTEWADGRHTAILWWKKAAATGKGTQGIVIRIAISNMTVTHCMKSTAGMEMMKELDTMKADCLEGFPLALGESGSKHYGDHVQYTFHMVRDLLRTRGHGGPIKSTPQPIMEKLIVYSGGASRDPLASDSEEEEDSSTPEPTVELGPFGLRPEPDTKAMSLRFGRERRAALGFLWVMKGPEVCLVVFLQKKGWFQGRSVSVAVREKDEDGGSFHATMCRGLLDKLGIRVDKLGLWDKPTVTVKAMDRHFFQEMKGEESVTVHVTDFFVGIKDFDVTMLKMSPEIECPHYLTYDDIVKSVSRAWAPGLRSRAGAMFEEAKKMIEQQITTGLGEVDMPPQIL